jgi:hypothetical protein
MGIARSTFYDKPAVQDCTAIVEAIAAICEEFEFYGWRRVRAELRHRGMIVNHKKIRRLMREHDLQPRRRRRYVATTDGDHAQPIWPNPAKDLAVDGPDQLWVADITYAFLEAERGEGWWGAESMADYYKQQSTADDPFNWIKAHPLMLSSAMEGYPFDHAGQGETSLLMALLPEGVDKSRIAKDEWYSRSAREASVELGIEGRDRILAHLRKALGVERANAQGARN